MPDSERADASATGNAQVCMGHVLAGMPCAAWRFIQAVRFMGF